MFEKAARLKLRFNYKGVCTVEDLWDLSLRALDSIFKIENAKLKVQKEESLLDVKSKEDTALNLKIEIIKHIFLTKTQEQEIRKNASERAAKKEKLLSIYAMKEDEALHAMSKEDIAKLIDEL